MSDIRLGDFIQLSFTFIGVHNVVCGMLMSAYTDNDLYGRRFDYLDVLITSAHGPMAERIGSIYHFLGSFWDIEKLA